MGLSLYNLLKACLLVVNALAVLHPHRFLAHYQLDTVREGTGMKQQIASMLLAARYMQCEDVAAVAVVRRGSPRRSRCLALSSRARAAAHCRLPRRADARARMTGPLVGLNCLFILVEFFFG